MSTIDRINPSDLPSPGGTHHQIVTSSSGTRVHISGQIALDEAGNVVGGGDFGAQADQAYQNLGRALTAVTASPAHVVKVTTYVVGYSFDHHWPAIKAAHTSLFGETTPAWTLLGVEALALPELRIEVEAEAVID